MLSLYTSYTETDNVNQSRGVVSDWTLTLYGSELTPVDVQERKRFVLRTYMYMR